MSDYQPQNKLYHYKSYCKYSLLYEAVMGRTKDLNEVTKSFKVSSLSCSLQSKRLDVCKPCGLHQGLRLRCCFERPSSMWETEDHATYDDKQHCRIARDQQVLVSHPTLPTLPIVELCFGARSLYCNHLSSVSERRVFVAANLQQNPCLTASRS